MDDDNVLIDTPKTSLGYDALIVPRFDDALHVKRISQPKPGIVSIISDNVEFYPSDEYHGIDGEVVGKVIWKA